MSIVTVYKDSTLEPTSQEINIFKTRDETYWSISTTIPKFARQYRNMLVSGKVVKNKNTDQIIELHGQLSNASVTLNAKREISDERRQELRERMKSWRNA